MRLFSLTLDRNASVKANGIDTNEDPNQTSPQKVCVTPKTIVTMFISRALLVCLFLTVTASALNYELHAGPCEGSDQCFQGTCTPYNATTSFCVCDRSYITKDGDNVCSYHQKSELVAFLLSLFVGGVGADWFYLAEGNGVYIFAGVAKLLTVGGFGIWWLVDWIRILCGDFHDGQGVPLVPF